MRIIRVKDDENDGKTLVWVAAGAALGLVAGALAAERLSGRRISSRMLWRRARGLGGLAVRRWQPLLGAAMALRDAWTGRDDDGDGAETEVDAEDEGFEAAAAEPEAPADGDEDEDEDGYDEDGYDEDEVVEEDAEDALDARVLEAFANDPVLAERSVEIEEVEEGRIVLHGRVHTAREVAHAVTIARGVPGVESVRQKLAVRDRR